MAIEARIPANENQINANDVDIRTKLTAAETRLQANEKHINDSDADISGKLNQFEKGISEQLVNIARNATPDYGQIEQAHQDCADLNQRHTLEENKEKTKKKQAWIE